MHMTKHFSKYYIYVTDLSCQQASFCSPVCFRRVARLQRQTVCSKQLPEEPPLSHSAFTEKQLRQNSIINLLCIVQQLSKQVHVYRSITFIISLFNNILNSTSIIT